MRIYVNRFTSTNNASLSLVSIDGAFECFGLEDESRVFKIAGETRIPAGIYDMVLRTFGGTHLRYASKFPEIHKGMLEICNVPSFTDVLIHIGNTDRDTAGCLLVGANANTTGTLSLSSSRTAYTRLYEKVAMAAEEGRLSIEVIDADKNPEMFKKASKMFVNIS